MMEANSKTKSVSGTEKSPDTSDNNANNPTSHNAPTAHQPVHDNRCAFGKLTEAEEETIAGIVANLAVDGLGKCF